MLNREFDDLHVALPAKILKYNSEEMRADIQLLIKKDLGDNEVEMPPIIEVPVAHFKAGSFIIRPPYREGDVVQVLFNERAIDNLLVSNRPRSVEFKRRHSFDDAVIVGGFKTEREANYPAQNGEDFLIANLESGDKFILKKAGGVIVESNEVKLGSENAREKVAFKSDLEKLINELATHTHTGNNGAPTTTPLKPFTQPIGSTKVVVE